MHNIRSQGWTNTLSSNQNTQFNTTRTLNDKTSLGAAGACLGLVVLAPFSSIEAPVKEKPAVVYSIAYPSLFFTMHCQLYFCHYFSHSGVIVWERGIWYYQVLAFVWIYDSITLLSRYCGNSSWYSSWYCCMTYFYTECIKRKIL